MSNEAHTAKYIVHPNKAYRGNPFIESLGFPLSLTQFVAATNIPFTSDLDLSETPAELHSYYSRTAIDGLLLSYVVKDEAYQFYDLLRRMIEAGYVRRNPIGPDSNRLLVAVERDKNDPMKAVHINSLELVDAKLCTFLSGLSGIGKTTMIKNILKLIPESISHSSYQVSNGELVELDQVQITHLYIEVHNRRGKKAVLISILEALDNITKENYSYKYRNSNTGELMTIVRKAVIIHAIGLIFIDEAQNLSRPSKTETLGANEQASMKFIEEIFNVIGVPLCFVGTLSMLNLFKSEATVSRRATASGSLILGSCDVNSSFWNRFIKEMSQISFMANQQTAIADIRDRIHFITCGVPAIAASIIKATLSYLTFLDPIEQDLSVAALDQIFDEQFKVLKPSLDALRSGDYHLFEDLRPLLLLEEVISGDDSIKDVAESIIKDQEVTNTQKSKSLPLQGTLAVAADREKRLQDGIVQQSSSNLKPNNVLANLGYTIEKGTQS